jgi:adenosyl cobinamide kinase/adenosyl cobinamide phosphate guanylyltransferase
MKELSDMLIGIQSMNALIQKHTKSQLRMWESIYKSSLFSANIGKRSVESLITHSLIDAIQNHVDTQNKMWASMDRSIQSTFDALVEPMRRFQKWMNDQEEPWKESILALAERGWYLDPSMPIGAIGQFADAIGETPDEVDTLLIAH